MMITLADPQMTLSFQIHDRVQELRREVVEILATDQPGHHSGPEKVKHDKRIERLWQIRNELFALIAKRRIKESNSCSECGASSSTGLIYLLLFPSLVSSTWQFLAREIVTIADVTLAH